MPTLQRTPREMTHTLRALAWLLRYPDAELRAALPALCASLHAERALGEERLAELDALVSRLSGAPALRAEADYVDLFDRSRRTALHLFEHVHGDSRDRGQAMVDLIQTYESAGLCFAGDELPDYLPVVLEFASTQPSPSGREFLSESAHVLRAIFTGLRERQSLYASVLAGVLELAGERIERVALPDEVEIDESWTEPPAFGGCSSAGQSRPNEPQPIHIVRPAAARPRPGA